MKNQAVLVRAVLAAVSGMLPGPFAYAESWDEGTNSYKGVAIDKSANTPVVVDSQSVIITPGVALAYLAARTENIPALDGKPSASPGNGAGSTSGETASSGGDGGRPGVERLPTRFVGTVLISAERPARDIHQIVEAIVEQLTTLPGSEVTLKLEIDAEVPAGLDRAKVRTLLENATTLGFLEKIVS